MTAAHAKRSAGKPRPSACMNCSGPDQHDHVLQRSLESALDSTIQVAIGSFREAYRQIQCVMGALRT